MNNWYKKALYDKTSAITVQDMGYGVKCIPIITLRGKWLLDAGFFPKDKLNVNITDGNIVLSMKEKADPNRVKEEQTRTDFHHEATNFH